MFIVVHYCLCHSDSASVLLYLIVSSLLTIVPFAVRGWLFCIHEGNEYILRRTFIYKLPLLQAFTAAQDMLIPQVPLVSLGQCRSIVVHCCLCNSYSASDLLYVPILFTSNLFFSFNLKISTHKAKK